MKYPHLGELWELVFINKLSYSSFKIEQASISEKCYSSRITSHCMLFIAITRYRFPIAIAKID
jgi:hypothetical protein